MNNFLKISAIIFFLTLITVSFFAYWGIYSEKDPQGEEVVFVVKRGEGLLQIADHLEKEGIIKERHFFVLYVIFSGKEKNLKAGNYLLSSAMSVAEIAREMFRGSENRVTVVEGWNLRNIAHYLEEKGFDTKEEFYYLAGKPPEFKEGELKQGKEGAIEREGFLEEIPEGVSIEGFLFPDTYYISPGTPIEDVIDAMLLNFEDRVVEGLKDDLENTEMSLYEVITLASLLEKEVRDFEEKRLVAGIIKERMRREMRLQIDATISYLTGRRSVAIPISETKIDSAYNTYVYPGLPQGPICSPGIDSIKAALSPKESDYLYYLSKPTGETVFSRTHDEHVEAKNRYLR